jgi:hypothetical protein
MFTKATKKQAKLRLALIGVAGSGKTYTALSIAKNLGSRIAVIDTERGSASKYSDVFAFDVLELDSFSPERYVEGIAEAGKAGYEVLVIDSLSHAWAGNGGILEFVDNTKAADRSVNNFSVWRKATPLHNKLVDSLLAAPLHLIVTMRAKTEYAQEKDERTGKTSVRKVGLQPVQRDGLEYEFDVVADLDPDNNFIVTKTRCSALAGKVFSRAGSEVAEVLTGWLSDGTAPTVSHQPPTPATLSKERAHKMHQELGKLGIDNHHAFAAGVLGREVDSFTELSEAEALEVWAQARKGMAA